MSNLLEIEQNYMEYSHFSIHNLEKNRSLNRWIHKLCIFDIQIHHRDPINQPLSEVIVHAKCFQTLMILWDQHLLHYATENCTAKLPRATLPLTSFNFQQCFRLALIYPTCCYIIKAFYCSFFKPAFLVKSPIFSHLSSVCMLRVVGIALSI